MAWHGMAWHLALRNMQGRVLLDWDFGIRTGRLSSRK
jgi:hypothetical protein